MNICFGFRTWIYKRFSGNESYTRIDKAPIFVQSKGSISMLGCIWLRECERKGTKQVRWNDFDFPSTQSMCALCSSFYSECLCFFFTNAWVLRNKMLCLYVLDSIEQKSNRNYNGSSDYRLCFSRCEKNSISNPNNFALFTMRPYLSSTSLVCACFFYLLICFHLLFFLYLDGALALEHKFISFLQWFSDWTWKMLLYPISKTMTNGLLQVHFRVIRWLSCLKMQIWKLLGAK